MMLLHHMQTAQIQMKRRVTRHLMRIQVIDTRTMFSSILSDFGAFRENQRRQLQLFFHREVFWQQAKIRRGNSFVPA